MAKRPFRTPAEYAKQEDEPKRPVSTRIPESVAAALEAAAGKQDKSLGWLMAQVLEDYATWLAGKGD